MNVKMKLKVSLLGLSLVCGLTACGFGAERPVGAEETHGRGGQAKETPTAGHTYVSVAISTMTSNPRLKAVRESEDYNYLGEYTGRDKFRDVTVFLVSQPSGEVTYETFRNLEPTVVSGSDAYLVATMETEPRRKEVYVLINAESTDLYGRLTSATSVFDFKTAYEAQLDNYDLISEDGKGVSSRYASSDGTNDYVTMNGEASGLLMAMPGVKKSEAEAGTSNYAEVSVRRLFARVVVTSASDSFETVDLSSKAASLFPNSDLIRPLPIADLTDLKWDVMQYEQQSYLKPRPTEKGKDPMLPNLCYTPSYDFVQRKNDNSSLSLRDMKYVYHDFDGIPVEVMAGGKVSVDGIVSHPMKYVTETTHRKGDKLQEGDDDGMADNATGYRKGNTPYVVVSAKIQPKAWADEEERTNYQEGKDLYWGQKNGFFYSNLAKAQEANAVLGLIGDGRDNVLTYKGGRCYYYAWLNPDEGEVNSPVIRNNIYHISIVGFRNVGYTRDPFNPNPTDPDPDPDEIIPDPWEPLYNLKTAMSTKIKVVPMGVHTYEKKF